MGSLCGVNLRCKSPPWVGGLTSNWGAVLVSAGVGLSMPTHIGRIGLPAACRISLICVSSRLAAA